jgi:hypothetical protein
VGLISFTDSAGIRWRVWQVDTPAARAHLLEPSYRSGWLVFEREDGEERRRLQQVPDGWTSLSHERLELLCSVAAPVVSGRTGPSGQQAVWTRPDADTRTDR